MTEKRARRRLAAILAADVVGYSRLMESDELSTLNALKTRRRDLLDPLIKRHQGRLVKVMGDGVLVEFASAVNAVQCAVELQERMEESNCDLPESRRIILRIGINIGDVIVEGGDLYGDGVNVAARLEGLAAPGEIYVSGSVYEQVKRKLDCSFHELGPRTVKHITDPVNVYRVQSPSASPQETKDPPAEPLALPAKPSIAVLPFSSMSDDRSQEYFVDGLTEDLITDLSRNAGLFVIARHSSFAYKGKSIDVRQIARDLGVRYLLEGSARRFSGRLRINVQLIDAIGGDHIWADRFDRNEEDIFAIQDEVIGKIVQALVGRLIAPPARNRPSNLDAYDLCVRGRALLGKSPEAGRESRLLMQQAIALDPNYAEAHRLFAFHLWSAWALWGESMDPNRQMAVAAAERAVALDPNDAASRLVLGHVLAYEGRWPEADAAFAAAIEIDPSHADTWSTLADVAVWRGDSAAGLEHARRALRLNPYPPGWYYWNLGLAHYAAREYELAIAALTKESTYGTASRRILAASLAQFGKIEEARREAALFLASNPLFTIEHWASTQPFRNEATRDHFVEGYRMAGLPD